MSEKGILGWWHLCFKQFFEQQSDRRLHQLPFFLHTGVPASKGVDVDNQ
jgi:hypothetical protein